VLDYGPETERRIPVGARVSSLPILSGPNGRRIIGQNPDAPGGFGEYFLLTEAITKVVPSGAPSEVVCVSDAIAVGWSAAHRAAVAGREVPIVIGCGAIGLSVVATLRLLGVGPIVAVDLAPARRQTARRMGADVVVDPAATSPYEAWGNHSPAGYVVFECVGVRGVLATVIKNCARDTRIFSMGGPPEGDVLPTLTAKRKGINIQFGGGPLPAHWDAAFEAVCSGRLDVAPMLGATVGIDGVSAALDASRSADAPARIVVVP
jgi:threonine dehydrogenase-like Zn-dependent dehydrogenase